MQSTGKELLARIAAESRIREFGKLNPEWFEQDEKSIFSFVSQYLKVYGVLPSLKTLSEKCGVQAPEANPYQFVYDELVNRVVLNGFQGIIPKVNTLIQEGKPIEAMHELKEMISHFDSSLISVKDIYTLKELGEEVLAHIEQARTSGGMTGVPTPWATLNKTLSGHQAGDLNLFLARPKMGKSAAMIASVDSALEAQYITMLISMEMAVKQQARRLIAYRSKVSMNAIKTGQICRFAEDRIRRMVEAIDPQTPFYYVEGQFKKSVGEIESLIHGIKPHIVFIDGGYLLKLAGSGKMAKWERMTEIAESLKSIAMTAGIPLVVSFQFTRGVKKDDPQSAGFENIQLADAIGQIASVGIGIFETSDDPILGTKRRRIEVVGGREGETASFLIHWDWERMNFSEIEEARGGLYDQTNEDDD